MKRYFIAPVGLAAARKIVGEHHRHCVPPQGHKASVAIMTGDGDMVGVVCVGRPTNRVLQDRGYGEILRVCIIGEHEHACSFAFARGRELARALGFASVVTYNLEGESGSSLRAAGFRAVAHLPARPSMTRGSSRVRSDGRRPVEPKTRWEWP